MSDLLDAIRTVFPPVLSGHLAARLGTSVNSMKRMFEGAVPVMLGGLTNAATQNAALVYELCQQPVRTDVTGILVLFGSRYAVGRPLQQGEELLTVAFDDSEQAVISELSRYAGLQPALVRSLLALVGTALLGVLGKQAARHALSAEDTAAVLGSLKAKMKAMLPAELDGLAEVAGLRSKPHWHIGVTAYTAVRQLAVQRTEAPWYIVAALVLLITGAGVVALGALRPAVPAQQAMQTALTPGLQIGAKVIRDSSPERNADF